jgi:hypothetical protein
LLRPAATWYSLRLTLRCGARMGAGPHWRRGGAGPSVPRVVTGVFVTGVPVVGTEATIVEIEGGKYA